MALNRFSLDTELKQPGYPALVRALGQNLDKLAALIAKELNKLVKSKKAEQIYVYFNNDTNAYAVKNALYLKDKFKGGKCI